MDKSTIGFLIRAKKQIMPALTLQSNLPGCLCPNLSMLRDRTNIRIPVWAGILNSPGN